MSRTNEDLYPAVNAAFEFVGLTYQIAMARYEAQHTRLMNIAGISVATSGALLVFSASVIDPIRFDMTEFYAAVILFASALVIVGIGLFTGGLNVSNPSVMYKKQLHWSDWEFKKNAIYHAGQHLERTTEVINTKHRLAALAVLAFVGELTAAGLWINALTGTST